MAGDVQQPFSLSFQVDALHSSSISFGRFDLHSLSWERRSSFSHNRYLEDVEKYARPGSVTEKKAYFEAHFKQRALLRQASSESQVQKEESVSENSSYGAAVCEDNKYGDWSHGEVADQHMADKDIVCQFDESPEGSTCYEDVGGIGYERNSHSESYMGSVSDNDFVNTIGEVSEHPDHSSSTVLKEGENENQAEDIAPSESQVALDAVPSKQIVKEETWKIVHGHDHVSVANVLPDIVSDMKPHDQILYVSNEDISPAEAANSNLQTSQNHAPKSLRATDKTRSSGIKSRCQRDKSVTKKPDASKGSSLSTGLIRATAQNTGGRERETPIRVKAQKQLLESNGSTAKKTGCMERQTPLSTRTQKAKSESIRSTAQSTKRRETQTPLRAGMQEQMPDSARTSMQSSLRLFRKENSQTSNPNTPQGSQSEKENRPKRAVTPQPSMPKRSERQRPSSSSSFRSIGSAEKWKENPQTIKPYSPDGARSEKEIRPKKAVTLQPSTPRRSEAPRPLSSSSRTKHVTSADRQMGQSITDSSFRTVGSAEKWRENSQTSKPHLPHTTRSEREIRRMTAVTQQPSASERIELRRPTSSSSFRQSRQTAMNSSFRCPVSAEKWREEKMATEIRQISGKLDMKEKQKPFLCRGTIQRGSSGEKSQPVPNSSRLSKAPAQTSLTANRMAAGPKPGTNFRDRHEISLSKSARFHGTLDRTSR